MSRSMTGFVWLDLTRKCQLTCSHCHNQSEPEGTHGTMTGEDWTRVLSEIASAGIPHVQFTGGEVTMNPDAPTLVEHALALGLKTEIYSNLAHVNEDWWKLLRRDGVSLATSYYGSRERHNAVTGRSSHARTRSNIVRAVECGIPLRASVIVPDLADTGDDARRELTALRTRGGQSGAVRRRSLRALRRRAGVRRSGRHGVALCVLDLDERGERSGHAARRGPRWHGDGACQCDHPAEAESRQWFRHPLWPGRRQWWRRRK